MNTFIEKEGHTINNNFSTSSKNINTSGYIIDPILSSNEYYFCKYYSAKSFYDEQIKYDGQYRRTSLETCNFEDES